MGLFGNEFVAGESALWVLCIVQLINATSGPVIVVRTMTGNESIVARTLSYGAAANISLNVVLIPEFGATGAAAATSLTYLIWKTALAFSVYLKHNFNPTIFSR